MRTETCSIARAGRDGTRAETRFRLSTKRTSPFKSVGASVQSTAGSRGMRISLSNAGYTVFRGSVRVLATHSASFPFTSPPVRHPVPPGSERALQCYMTKCCVGRWISFVSSVHSDRDTHSL